MEYYNSKESVQEYIKMADGFDGLQLIEKLKGYLPEGSSLLEIGSGPGTDWRILNDYFEVVGSDNSPEFLRHLKVTNPNAEFLQLNATTLSTSQKFDGIYSNKVLHHLNDKELEASIERQHQILNTGGFICHSFWKGEGSEIFKGMFVNYHTARGIEDIFKNLFEILLIEDYTEFDKDDSILLIGKRSWDAS